MSDQSLQPDQNTLAASALRQRMLDQMNASQKVIEELSDEELENIAGGGLGKLLLKTPAYIAVASLLAAPGLVYGLTYKNG